MDGVGHYAAPEGTVLASPINEIDGPTVEEIDGLTVTVERRVVALCALVHTTAFPA